jgi:hypothetical protein
MYAKFYERVRIKIIVLLKSSKNEGLLQTLPLREAFVPSN